MIYTKALTWNIPGMGRGTTLAGSAGALDLLGLPRMDVRGLWHLPTVLSNCHRTNSKI
jgi:hypothetical protein